MTPIADCVNTRIVKSIPFRQPNLQIPVFIDGNPGVKAARGKILFPGKQKVPRNETRSPDDRVENIAFLDIRILGSYLFTIGPEKDNTRKNNGIRHSSRPFGAHDFILSAQLIRTEKEIITVQGGKITIPRPQDTSMPVYSYSKVLFVEYRNNSLIETGILTDNLRGIVQRGIINKDYLKISMILRKDTLQTTFQIPAIIIIGDNNGYAVAAIHPVL
jgi:hypothetical protein